MESEEQEYSELREQLEDLVEIVEVQDQNIDILKKINENLKNMIVCQREESDVLWWMLNKWSSNYKKAFSDMKKEELAIAIPLELYRYSQFELLPYSTERIINSIIKECENSSEKVLLADYMKNINEDIIGWIKIDNTNINYPILKDTDNLKYLKHSFDGKYNNNGSIFTLNNNPFQDYETVLYGHNMKSGIMFSELGKYMNKEFFDKHSSFEIYTKNQNYKATVFSCYSIGINKEENNIKLLDFEEQVEYYKKASKYSVDNVGEIKKIVKLSTCSYLNNHTTPTDQRYYIVAKLEKVN